MVTNTRFNTLFVILFVLASSFAVALRLDQNGWPVIVTPADSSLAPGDSTQLNITMNQAGSTPTTVYLSSSQPGVLTVPMSVTVPAGSTGVQTVAATMGIPGSDPKPKNGAVSRSLATVVRVTASANGRSAYTDITVQ